MHKCQTRFLCLNTICQEGRYSELETKHKDLPTAMETEGLQEKLEQFDTVMGSQCPLFKFSRDYRTFVKCILMFMRASRNTEESETGISTLSPSRRWQSISLPNDDDRLNYARHVPLYLMQMHRLRIDDPDIHHEFMQGSFSVK